MQNYKICNTICLSLSAALFQLLLFHKRFLANKTETFYSNTPKGLLFLKRDIKEMYSASNGTSTTVVEGKMYV